MTFDTIVSRVMDRLNLTSDAATTRVGDEVNEVYASIISGLGLQTSARGEITGFTTNGDRFLTFGEDADVEKIMLVWDPTQTLPAGILEEFSFQEMRRAQVVSWPPTAYAISRMSATSVEVYLNAVPTADDQQLEADAMVSTVEMSGDDEPNFPGSYHDILIHGVMAIELLKMEKGDLSKVQSNTFDRRLSELRFYIVKSGTKKSYQGKGARPVRLVPVVQ